MMDDCFTFITEEVHQGVQPRSALAVDKPDNTCRGTTAVDSGESQTSGSLADAFADAAAFDESQSTDSEEAAVSEEGSAGAEVSRKRKRQSAAASATRRRNRPKVQTEEFRRIPREEFRRIPPEGKHDDLPCVFVQRHGAKRAAFPDAVVLWPQYELHWQGAALPACQWVIVAPQEYWVKKLVDSTTTSYVRPLARKLCDDSRDVFRKALEDARLQARQHPEPPGASRCGKPKIARASSVRRTTVEVSLGEHTVACVNTHNKMAMLLDDRTKKMIADLLVDLLKKRVQASTGTDGGSLSSPDGPNAPFFIPPNRAPTHRDKVVWKLGESCWAIRAKVADGSGGATMKSWRLNVDRALDGEKFAEERIRVGKQAVHEWNEADLSNAARLKNVE